MLLAQEVLHAYTMISISMMVVFTSLREEATTNTQESDNPGTNPLLQLNRVCPHLGTIANLGHFWKQGHLGWSSLIPGQFKGEVSGCGESRV